MRSPLVEAALVGLSRQTQDTVMLSARLDNEALCLECEEGAFPIKVRTQRAGDRRPLGIGRAGIALVAYGDKSDLMESRAAFAEKSKPNFKGWLDPQDRHRLPKIEEVK